MMVTQGDAPDDRVGFTLRELEVLRALVQAGKTTTAAQRLGMSQSAISRSLSQLESELGRTLFERAGGRLLPTREAVAISEELGPVFAALGRISDRTRSAPRSHTGSLRIVAPPTMAHRFLPSRVARFTKENPELEVIFDVLSSDSLVTSIAEARHDVALTDTEPAHAGVRSSVLIESEAVCALPSRHRLSVREEIHPEDLEDEPFISLTRRHSGRISIDRLFERTGVRRKIVIETATAVSAAEFVREGLGVSLLNPFPIAHHFTSGIVMRPFTPKIAYRTSFLFPSSQPPNPAAQAFMDMTRTSLK